MQAPLIGHPQRLEPLKNFLGYLAKAKEPTLLTGPTDAGEKQYIHFLAENGPLNQAPLFFLNGLDFSEALWNEAHRALGDILTKPNFRTKIIKENLVTPLLKDGPGFLVFNLTDQEFEKKTIWVYNLISNHLISRT
jgi:hypothetical protein